MATTSMYNTPEWKALRLIVLKRDGWCCTCCGVSVRAKGAARVDHIKTVKQFPHLAWDKSNLRTLCAPCDNKRHSEKGGNQQQRPAIGMQGYPADWM